MKLLELLREHGLQNVVDTYKLHYKRHSKYSNIISIQYDQIKSPLDKAEVRQARGIVVDERNNYKVLAYSFDKFFNAGEPLATSTINTFNAREAYVQEKLDGSLIIMYWNTYSASWEFATSGTPDGSGTVYGNTFTFAELARKTFEESNYLYPLSTCDCYTFELTSPYNQIVVKQSEPKLTLIGVRNLSTLEEVSPASWYNYNYKYNWEVVECIPYYEYLQKKGIKSFDNLIKSVGEENPYQSEGLILVDSKFNRLKIKNPEYVALHYFKTSFSTKNLAEIVRSGFLEQHNEEDEFFACYPGYKEQYLRYKQAYQDLIFNISFVFNMIKDIKDQKEFAAEANKFKYNFILFNLRKNPNTTVQAEVDKTYPNTFESLLESVSMT